MWSQTGSGFSLQMSKSFETCLIELTVKVVGIDCASRCHVVGGVGKLIIIPCSAGKFVVLDYVCDKCLWKSSDALLCQLKTQIC